MPPINRKKKLIRWNRAIRMLEAKKKTGLAKKKVKEEEVLVSHFMKAVKEECEGSNGIEREQGALPSSQSCNNIKVVKLPCGRRILPSPSCVNLSSPLSIGNFLIDHQHHHDHLTSNGQIHKYFESVRPCNPDVMEAVKLHNTCKDPALQVLHKVNIGMMVQMSKIMQEVRDLYDAHKKLPLVPDDGNSPLPRLHSTKFGIARTPSTSFKFITMENFYFQDCDFNLVYTEERRKHPGMHEDEEENRVAFFMQACVNKVLKDPAFACCLTCNPVRTVDKFVFLPAEFTTTMRDFILVIAEESVNSEYAIALHSTFTSVIDRMRNAARLTYAADFRLYLREWPKNNCVQKNNKLVLPRQILPTAKRRML